MRLIAATVLIVCCREVSGQSVGFGRCPSYPAMKTLDLKKVGLCLILHTHNILSPLPTAFPSACCSTKRSFLKHILHCVGFVCRYLATNWLTGVILVVLQYLMKGDNEDAAKCFRSGPVSSPHAYKNVNVNAIHSRLAENFQVHLQTECHFSVVSSLEGIRISRDTKVTEVKELEQTLH